MEPLRRQVHHPGQKATSGLPKRLNGLQRRTCIQLRHCAYCSELGPAKIPAGAASEAATEKRPQCCGFHRVVVGLLCSLIVASQPHRGPRQSRRRRKDRGRRAWSRSATFDSLGWTCREAADTQRKAVNEQRKAVGAQRKALNKQQKAAHEQRKANRQEGRWRRRLELDAASGIGFRQE